MPHLKFSAPYNNRFETLEKVVEKFGDGMNGNKIEEFYMSGLHQYFGSGRTVPPTTIKALVKAIDFCHKNDIKVDLLLNSQCEGLEWYNPEHIKKLILYLKNLYEKHSLDAVTIANPLFIQRIRKEFPKLEIVASVIGEIDSVQRAMFYEKLGANVITPDRDINRDLEKLKEIKEATDCKLRLMVNEGCLYRCPYRIFHYNLISHGSIWNIKSKIKLAGDFPHQNCSMILKVDTSQVLKSSWIRPEDLDKYKDVTNYFKIVDRQMPTERIVKTLNSYITQKHDGDLLELMGSSLCAFRNRFHVSIDNNSLNGFFEKVTSCKKNCHKCNYCEKLAKKVVKFPFK